MTDKVITVNSIEEFHKRIERYRTKSAFKFRGQSNSQWKLIPKAGRFNKKVTDKRLFEFWKSRAVAYIDKNYSDWELLSIAQHTGLPTRLLDWSHNPLIASFFAAFENFDADGILFAYNPIKELDTTETTTPFPISKKSIEFYRPNASSPRIINQYGHFTVHFNPKLALDDSSQKDRLEITIIPKELKKDLIFMLNHYGINYLTIYPDLEGLSKHLTWFLNNYEYWKSAIEE